MPSPPGDLPNPGIKPGPPTLHADSLLFEPPVKPLYGNSGSVIHGVGGIIVICLPNPLKSSLHE